MNCTCDLLALPGASIKDGRIILFELKLVKCQLCEAAPDLLDACKFALNSPAPMDRHLVVKRLKAAIEKAEKH